MVTFKRSNRPSDKITREYWLNNAITHLRPMFADAAATIPANVRVTCGWPSTGALAKKHRRIGEAWSSDNSRSKHFEIFISPVIDKPTRVLDILIHELIHVTVGLKCGHRGPFRKLATELGLVGKMTATGPSDALLERLNALVKSQLGDYPHAEISSMTNGKKKQGTRLIRVTCLGCCYTMRVTMTWILQGVPRCPNQDCPDHNSEMDVDLPTEQPQEQTLDADLEG